MTLALPAWTPARFAAVPRDVVYCVDALALLRSLPDASVQLVAVDPPYNGVKDDEWDNQWRDDDEFIAWLGALCQEWRRVLTANGSLYVCASSRLAARVEMEVGRWFNVLNRITWSKPKFATKAEMFDKDTMRAYFPASEAIIFAEQQGADGEYTDAVIDGGQTYFGALQTTKRGIIGDYLEAEFKRAGVTNREIATLFPSRTGGLTGCVSNWLLGHNIPTREQYAAMRDYLNARAKADDYLRREYEDLRREYEDLRRPFNSHPFAPYTDVWDFPTVGHYPGKHPAEKPLAMMEHIVNISSRPGDTVLDCFCGSGTTLDAARRNGRHYIGGDFTQHWVDYARRRVSHNYDVKLPLFEVTA